MTLLQIIQSESIHSFIHSHYFGVRKSQGGCQMRGHALLTCQKSQVQFTYIIWMKIVFKWLLHLTIFNPSCIVNSMIYFIMYVLDL